MDLLTASESKWVLSRFITSVDGINPQTYREGGCHPPQGFSKVFSSDKGSAPDVFSSCPFIPCLQFESRLVMVSFVWLRDMILIGSCSVWILQYGPCPWKRSKTCIVLEQRRQIQNLLTKQRKKGNVNIVILHRKTTRKS